MERRKMQMMVSGILSDFRGRVFLRQLDAMTLGPIHGPLEIGTPPAVTLDRLFRRQTGLIVMPVRLTGLYFDRGVAGGRLTFSFRCTMRGGDLAIPAGESPAGFFDCPPLPTGLSTRFRRQVDDALHHAGGSPALADEAGGAVARLGRLLGRGTAEELDAWHVSVRLAVSGDGDNGVEWAVIGPDASQPATAADPAQPPWESAARWAADSGPNRRPAVNLVRVEQDPERPAVILVFAPAG
jgi:hypothetical protein